MTNNILFLIKIQMDLLPVSIKILLSFSLGGYLPAGCDEK